MREIKAWVNFCRKKEQKDNVTIYHIVNFLLLLFTYFSICCTICKLLTSHKLEILLQGDGVWLSTLY